jgi:hypothetical protein
VQVGSRERASRRAAPSSPGPERASRRPGRGAVLLMAGRLSWGRKAGLVNRASTRVFRAGGEEGCRHAVTRRRRRRRVRLPERRPPAAQRRHGREHLAGKHTPVPEPSSMLLAVGVEPCSRGARAERRRRAAVAAPPDFCRAPEGREGCAEC